MEDCWLFLTRGGERGRAMKCGTGGGEVRRRKGDDGEGEDFGEVLW